MQQAITKQQKVKIILLCVSILLLLTFSTGYLIGFYVHLPRFIRNYAFRYLWYEYPQHSATMFIVLPLSTVLFLWTIASFILSFIKIANVNSQLLLPFLGVSTCSFSVLASCLAIHTATMYSLHSGLYDQPLTTTFLVTSLIVSALSCGITTISLFSKKDWTKTTIIVFVSAALLLMILALLILIPNLVATFMWGG